MSRTQRATVAVAAVAVAVAATGGAAAGAPLVAPVGPHPVAVPITPGTGDAEALQNTPKRRSRPTVTVDGRRYAAPNPYLADLPSAAKVDWSYWRDRLTVVGEKRAAARSSRSRRVPTPVAYDEIEPVGTTGDNDTQADEERIGGFSAVQGGRAVKIAGRISTPPVVSRAVRTREDQGSIPLATDTGISAAHPRATVASRIGDGPFGSRRAGRGDFDFYRVHGVAGHSISATTRGSRLDTILAVYDAKGVIVALNDDAGGDDDEVTSDVVYDVPATGSYYVMVAGFSDASPTPNNPFRSGSGRGVGDEGAYRLQITEGRLDKDYYSVHLDAGDVLGGVLTGGAQTLAVHRTDGRTMVGSDLDASSAYPSQSPLPGGGATVAYVAETPGWYAVSVRRGTGRYNVLLEAYRPGSELAAPGAQQTIFLDFDGARINTNIFGGTGVSTLSPMSSFLRRWGLTRRDNAAVIRAVVDGVKENLRSTLAAQGSNPDVRVRVLNSRNHPDPFGQPNVSRVIVGGTISQTGVPTIGVAQSIDVGNYAHEETAMVLLDEVSQAAGAPDSFNTYLRARSDRVAFVGRALSNVVSHEAGHFIGSFHTDNQDRRADLMDAGGDHFARLYGVGPDGIGGTADDPDVDFGLDTLAPAEGFTGLENTLNTSAWGFRPGSTPR